jgi:hypothetical protein
MDRKMLSLAGPVDVRNAVSVALGLLVTASYVAQSLFLAFALAACFRSAALGRGFS